MKKAIALATIAIVGGVAFYLQGSKEATLIHLMEKYPHLDRDLAKKVYKQMMRDALNGTLEASDDATEEQMDDVFLARYNAATK